VIILAGVGYVKLWALLGSHSIHQKEGRFLMVRNNGFFTSVGVNFLRLEPFDEAFFLDPHFDWMDCRGSV